MGSKQFIKLVKSDLSRYLSGSKGIKRTISTFFLNAGFQLVFLYRLASFFYAKKIKIIPALIEWLQIVLFSSRIAKDACIGEQFMIAHPIGIVIGGITCGSGLTIWQNTTMGSHGNKDKAPAYPILGDNVKIFAHAIIIGGITIGSNSVIGAMTLVNKDVPQGCTVTGIPAKPIIKDIK